MTVNEFPELDVVRSAPLRVRAGDAAQATASRVMEVRFSPFGIWYEIDSAWEGRFLERTLHGAFAKTIKEGRSRVRALFNHGNDPQIGDKVLGTIEDLREDHDTAVGEVALFDTDYVRELLPGLEAGVYGSSMRMRVVKDEWNDNPGISDWNPLGLPERSIVEVRLYEFGPVTFPANPTATAAVRSTTDDYYDALRTSKPERVNQLELIRNSRSLPGRPRKAAPQEPRGLSFAQRERLIRMNSAPA